MVPLVTVLIPTYGRAPLLVEAIASAQRQTYSNLEIVILDDSSPDETASFVEPFLDDPRVRYVRHRSNLGIARNWQHGIVQVRGEYFCLLHDDDTLEATFVEDLLRPLQEDSSLVLAFCDQWVMDEKGRRNAFRTEEASQGFRRDTMSSGRLENFAQSALVENSIPAGGALYRHAVVKPDFVDARSRGSIDMWLLYRCWRTGMGAWFVPQRLMNYRVHNQGMSRCMPFEMIEGHIFRYHQMLEDPKLADLHGKFRARLVEAFEWLGMAYLRAEEFPNALDAFSKAKSISVTPKLILGELLARCGSLGAKVLRASDQLRYSLRK